MTDYYNTLGISKQATADEIKKSYRKLASQHHPDKGGDTKKFQEIEEAYRTLSDPEKRAQYDNPQPQHYGGMPPGFEDVFAQAFGQGFGDIFGNRRAQPIRNKNLNLQTYITLEDAFNGKELIADIQLPSGGNQTLEVKIPQGIRDGTVLRLSSMGDDSIPNAPRGDIHLSVHITQHQIFQRSNDDLVMTLLLNCLEAVVGCVRRFDTIDGRTLEMNIPAGTQHGQVMSVQGHGMPNMSDNRMRGRLLLNISLYVPKNITESQKDLIRQIIS